MASLIKRGTKYYLDFYDAHRTPRRKRVALGVSTKREAARLKAQREYEYAAGLADPWAPSPAERPRPEERGPAEAAPALTEAERAAEGDAASGREGRARPTAAEAAGAFYESRAHRAAATIRTYRDIVGRFVASLDPALAVADVRADHIEAWLDGTPAGDVARRTYTKHLSTYFRYCMERGWAHADPAQGVRLRRVPRRFPKALTPAEVERLLGAIGAGGPSVAWLRDVVEVAVETGLRRAELVSLRWGAVDLKAAVLTVACSEGFQPKGGAERRVPLGEGALAALRRVRGGRTRHLGAGDHVFRHRSGPLGPDYLSQRFARYARAAGLEGVGVHGLRHTAITRLIERGVPVPIVQRFAGHADVATTMRYCSIADEVYAGSIRAALAVRAGSRGGG